MEFSNEEAVQLRYRKAGSGKWKLIPAERREGLIRRKKLHHFQLNGIAPDMKNLNLLPRAAFRESPGSCPAL